MHRFPEAGIAHLGPDRAWSCKVNVPVWDVLEVVLEVDELKHPGLFELHQDVDVALVLLQPAVLYALESD
jgi:hypothetical protein